MVRVTGYSIDVQPHGILIRGPVPVDELMALLKVWEKAGYTSMLPGLTGPFEQTMAIARRGHEDAWRAEVAARAAQGAAGDVELEWLLGPDTGTSSLTIFAVLSARSGASVPADRRSPPWDPDDFGRCYRLLERIPAWRTRLHEVAAAYPVWAPLVREWPALEALYREELPKGTGPKLYQRMRLLLKEGGAR